MLLSEVPRTDPEFLLQWTSRKCYCPAEYTRVPQSCSAEWIIAVFSFHHSLFLSLSSCNRDSIYSPFNSLLSILLNHSFLRDEAVAFLLITLGRVYSLRFRLYLFWGFQCFVSCVLGYKCYFYVYLFLL